MKIIFLLIYVYIAYSPARYKFTYHKSKIQKKKKENSD